VRQLAAWQAAQEELKALGCNIYAASVDSLEHAQEVVCGGLTFPVALGVAKEGAEGGGGLTFPVAFGVTREEAGLIGAWWGEEHGGFIQPAEFLLGRGGVVLGALYASGPVGRMGADEAVRLITYRERRREQEQAAD
jgi:peroxiredoxin